MTFRIKTILGIAAIEIALLILLVLSSMSFLSSSNETLLLQRVDATATMLADSAKEAILQEDSQALDRLVTNFITLQDVQYVKIVRDGAILAYAGEKALLHREMKADHDLAAVNDGIFDQRINISDSNSSLGYIDMGLDTASISATLRNAQQSIITLASIEVILVAIFSFILGTYLTRNLTKLIGATKTLSKHGPGFQINSQAKDEFGDLTRAFDDMSSELARSYKALKCAREEAEFACESKGRFLASMSHEIRTPMNGVLGILSLLEETPLSRQQKNLLETATDSGSFLLSVINDILDFTRMESNTLLLESKTFNIHQCIESTTDSFAPSAKQKDLVLHCFIDSSVPTDVVGDANRVRQILHNLIGNAMKFTASGSVTIKVGITSQKENTITIRCDVIDTGIGILPTELEYIFEEFTMVDQSYSRTQEGAGLGLAICKRLCELMNGRINATSEEGVGSTFSFEIELEIAHRHERRSPIPNFKKGLDRSHARILVAEDNKANQLVIKNMLLNLGIDIDIADNGVETLNLLNQYHYDLIFMDISMPKMDGIQACQHIRQLKHKPSADTPIVALTAHALTGDKEHFLDAGMSGYLAKPVRLPQLVEKIDLFLNQSRQNTSIAEENKEPVMEKNTLKDNQPVNFQPSEISDLVDETIIRQTVEDTCAEVMPEIIEQYVIESRRRLENIQHAMQDANIETLEFETHTLGSSALALGNRKLSVLARKIEKLCLNKQGQQALSFCDQLTSLVNASLQALIERKEQGFESYSKPSNNVE